MYVTNFTLSFIIFGIMNVACDSCEQVQFILLHYLLVIEYLLMNLGAWNIFYQRETIYAACSKAKGADGPSMPGTVSCVEVTAWRLVGEADAGKEEGPECQGF